MIDLVTRRNYFDDYADTIEQFPPSLVEYGVRFSCPCCGYPTLRGRDEVCFLCRDSPEEREVRNAIIAAFDEMPATAMDDHERLWAAVVAGTRQLSPIR